MKNKVKDFLYEEESYKVRGACFDVWKEFKGMFKESIVDNALTIALKSKGLQVKSQERIDIYFQGKKVGTYVPDKIISDIILLELKAKPFITKQDVDQLWKYLRSSQYKLGFLVNFSPKELEIKRVVYDIARSASDQRINRRHISE